MAYLAPLLPHSQSESEPDGHNEADNARLQTFETEGQETTKGIFGIQEVN
jgi:hypothetical protein